MDVASHDQGARGAHADNPDRKDTLEEHSDPKMDPPLRAARARADTKAAIAEMQKHWAGLAQRLATWRIRRELRRARASVKNGRMQVGRRNMKAAFEVRKGRPRCCGGGGIGCQLHVVVIVTSCGCSTEWL